MNAFSNNSHRTTRRFKRVRGGFTLIELMVAMAVVVFLLLILLQIFGAVLESTRHATRQMVATKGNRVILDTLKTDLAHLVADGGLTVFGQQDETNNTRLMFLTQSRGPEGSDARCIAVSYHLEQGRLIRGVTPVGWSDIDLAGIASAPEPDGNQSVLAEGIVRFEANILFPDGQITLFPPADDDAGNWIENIPPPGGPANDRARAISVAVAALDPQTHGLPGSDAIGPLLDPADSETSYETWRSALTSGALDNTPRPALATLQISERSYRLK